MSPIRSLLRHLSPAGPSARLSILIFHRVRPVADALFPDEVDAARFNQICGWLQTWCQVLPLDVAAQRLADGSLPERAAAITFDDGYEDNASVAMPILQRHGLTATFFVASGYLDGGCMWNDQITESLRSCRAEQLDLGSVLEAGLPGQASYPLQTLDLRRAAVSDIIRRVKYLPLSERALAVADVVRLSGVAMPRDLMMTSEQLRSLRRGGMTVGAHTVSHPILAKLATADARQEIAQGKQALESRLDEPVNLFAYPNGRPGTDYSPETVALVRDCGFSTAVSTAWGAANASSDPLQLPRFTPWDRAGWRFGLRLAGNLRGVPA